MYFTEIKTFCAANRTIKKMNRIANQTMMRYILHPLGWLLSNKQKPTKKIVSVGVNVEKLEP